MTTPYATIAKARTSAEVVGCNMPDYDTERGRFGWAAAGSALTAAGAGTLNIAQAALDRQVAAGRGAQLAVRFVARDGTREDLSYSQLLAQSNRCANALAALGARRGDTVCALLGRSAALHIGALGTLKAGMVFCPLFSAFGPEPVLTRMRLGKARVLITTAALYLRKIAPIRTRLPDLAVVLIVADRGESLPADAVDFSEQLAMASEQFEGTPTAAGELALLHFTSGTTGQPKGVMHIHGAAVAQLASARMALDLRADDRYWCTADPGWVTGMTYGVIAPLLCGASSIVDREDFDPERWYRLLAEERVSVWYTAPTAIRMLMKAGDELARSRSYPALRFLASVGEPLNPEAVLWGQQVFGRPFHDNWWQTETGAIMMANYLSMDIKPGSMGRPLPGIEAGIVQRSAEGGVREIEAPDIPGELAIRSGWPSMFRGYLGNEEKYRQCFADGWYLSGDLARRDADGYYWFLGRSDDVIKSAGHLISPFEVESVLLAHPAVAQAGVIGIPDAVTGAAVKAFVELKPGHKPDDALHRELMAHARRQLGATIAPREIAFVATLPRTRSGKIMRRLLRARELGLPEGDLSTLEGGA